MKQEPKVSRVELIDKLNEIHTPLTNIRLSVDLIQSNIGEENIHDFYNIINNNAVKVEASIRELCAIIAEERYAPERNGEK
jgi:hypothetical protein